MATREQGTADTGLPARDVTVNQVVAWNLTYFRKVTGLRQEELGERLGWSKAIVSAAERSWDGKRVRQFSADDVVAIAMAVGVPVVALLLPPEGAGTATQYRFDLGAGTLSEMPDLLSCVVPMYAGDTKAMAAFRRRLLALGASKHIDPAVAAEDAEQILKRAKAEADELLTKASQEAEQVTRIARERAEALDRDALERIKSTYPPATWREVEELLGRARQEADDLLTRVRRKTEEILGDARARAESLERDAQQRHRQAMGSLVQSREELERRVDDLRAFEREYRSRMKAYHEGQIRDLEAGAADSGVFPAVGGGDASQVAVPPGMGRMEARRDEEERS